MNFFVRPLISSSNSLQDFLKDWNVGKKDLIVTNKFVIEPQLNGKELPCDIMFQEEYGSGEPSDEMVNAMLDEIDGKDYERIIAIGGGSVMDISKLLRFGKGMNVDELYAKGPELVSERKVITVPTTCGTGSEITNISVVFFKEKNSKYGLQIPQLFADEAVLIADMLKTLPYEVFATSSIDAMIHAIESHVSPKATNFSRAMGSEAIKMIISGYQKLVKQGENKLPEKEDMENFLMASTMAGIAFNNAGCATVHAMAFPLGGIYHIPHGMAVYLVFEEVFNQYKMENGDLSALNEILAQVFECDETEGFKKLFELTDKVLPRKPLREYGADEKICAEMAKSCFDNQQRLLVNSVVPMTEEKIKDIYVRCL